MVNWYRDKGIVSLTLRGIVLSFYKYILSNDNFAMSTVMLWNFMYNRKESNMKYFGRRIFSIYKQ